MELPKSKKSMIDTAIQRMQAKSKLKTEQSQSKAALNKLNRQAIAIGVQVAERRRQSDIKWSETKFATDTAISKFEADTKLRKQLGSVAFNAYKQRQKDIENKKRAGKSLLLRTK